MVQGEGMVITEFLRNVNWYISRRNLLLLLLLITMLSALTGDLSACIRCDLLAQLNAEISEPPRAVYRAPLYYPPELQRDMIAGTVILDVTVLPDSTIGYIEVTESIPELDSLAIANVREWEFVPAIRNDEPVIGTLTVEISFVPEFFDEEEEIPVSIPDLEKLQDKIDRVIDKQQEPLKHTLSLVNLPAYNENYHLISWDRYQPYLHKNRFTIIPACTIPIHSFQNCYPLYEQEVTIQNWRFETRDYELPVTFVDAYAGLGYLNMDYGHIRLAKNDFLDLEDFRIGTSILFQDGYWMGMREKSSNYTLDTRLPVGPHTFRWYFLHINQDIPANKWRDQYEYLANVGYSEKISEHSLLWDNPVLNIGFRYEKLKYSDTPLEEQPERTLYQLMLKRDFEWRHHYLGLTWEYFDLDDSEGISKPYLTESFRDIGKIVYKYRNNNLDIWSENYSGNSYKYHTHSELNYRFSDYVTAGIGVLDNSPRTESYDYIRTIIARDLYSTVAWKSVIGDIRATLGERDYIQYGDTKAAGNSELNCRWDTNRNEPKQELTTLYIEGEHILMRSYGVTDWSLLSHLNARLDNELDYFPLYYGKVNLECRYNLLHDNAITAGLIYHYTGEFTTPHHIVESAEMLDGYIRISITRLFDIQADARNLLQSESLYGYPVAGIHWNVGIRWYFLN